MKRLGLCTALLIGSCFAGVGSAAAADLPASSTSLAIARPNEASIELVNRPGYRGGGYYYGGRGGYYYGGRPYNYGGYRPYYYSARPYAYRYPAYYYNYGPYYYAPYGRPYVYNWGPVYGGGSYYYYGY